jgi:hypothetical protein
MTCNPYYASSVYKACDRKLFVTNDYIRLQILTDVYADCVNERVNCNRFKTSLMLKGFPFLLFVPFFNSCSSSINDNELIKKCFAKYKLAILAKDGKSGVECVDSATINFYSSTLYKVIKFDSLQIEKLPTIDKYTILKIRQNFPQDSIVQMDGKSLLLSLINKGFAGNSNIAEYELGNAKIINDSAIVEKVINGKRTPFIFRFRKEAKSWKLCTFSAFEQIGYNWGIKNAIVKSKLSEDSYILNYIETTSVSKKLFRNRFCNSRCG